MSASFFHDEKGGLRVFRIIGITLGGLSLATLLAIGLGWLVEYLWNHTLAVMFKLPAITYWQAVGLFILGKLLFGGFAGHHGGHHHEYGHGHGHGPWHSRKCRRWREDLGVEAHERFRDFWEAEGRKAFEDYLEKNPENG